MRAAVRDALLEIHDAENRLADSISRHFPFDTCLDTLPAVTARYRNYDVGESQDTAPNLWSV